LDLSKLSLRELQTESARALTTIEATNNNIWQFNQAVHHDSHKWYRTVIEWYVKEYGNLPSLTGPGQDVKLILEE